MRKKNEYCEIINCCVIKSCHVKSVASLSITLATVFFHSFFCFFLRQMRKSDSETILTKIIIMIIIIFPRAFSFHNVFNSPHLPVFNMLCICMYYTTTQRYKQIVGFNVSLSIVVCRSIHEQIE